MRRGSVDSHIDSAANRAADPVTDRSASCSAFLVAITALAQLDVRCLIGRAHRRELSAIRGARHAQLVVAGVTRQQVDDRENGVGPECLLAVYC